MRPSDEEIMAVIRAKPGLRMGEIMRELGIEETSANKGRMVKSITSLKKWKFIEPIDDIRPTRWKEYGVDVDVPIRKRKRTSIKICREYGMDYGTVCARLDRGWSEEEALNTPVGVRRKSKEKTLFGKCREHGLNYTTVRNRLARGWSEEKALTTPIKRYKHDSTE